MKKRRTRSPRARAACSCCPRWGWSTWRIRRWPRGWPEVSEQLEVFATQMRQVLLAAPSSIGLDVMGELIYAEVTDAVGPKGRHDKDQGANSHANPYSTATEFRVEAENALDEPDTRC